MIKLIKLVQVGTRYTFDDLLVNPDSVSSLEADHSHTNLLREDTSKFPEGLSESTKFSTLKTLNGVYTVVGSPETISEKLRKTRTLLKG